MAVFITGKVASEPRTFVTRNGKTTVSISVPVKVYDDDEGETTVWVEATQWYEPGKEDSARKYEHMVGKGAAVSIYGDLAKRHYDGKDGTRKEQVYVRYPKIEVIAPAPKVQDVTQAPRPAAPKPDPYDPIIPF